MSVIKSNDGNQVAQFSHQAENENMTAGSKTPLQRLMKLQIIY